MLYPDTLSVDNLYYEREMRGLGFTIIAGVDEVGRGCLAGPVVACAVILPEDVVIDNVTDSKRLTASQRESLSIEIKKIALSHSISVIEPQVIDEINIRNASITAMKLAIDDLNIKPSCVLVDGNTPLPILIPQKTIIKGDILSHTISCASILAKVYRDKLMEEYDKIYPHYGFSVHKGYPTKYHKEIIRKFGITPIHRKSFRLE